MLAASAHRGPDAILSWSEGCAAFGHAMLQTTPESTHEVLPLVSTDDSLVLTSDARIDNRAELLQEFSDKAKTNEQAIPDSQIILWAYEKWGQDCANHLIGDFAFAVYDTRSQSIFCARDHFGIKPLYYYLSESHFAFATEQKALLSLDFVNKCVNESRVADFIVDITSDCESTFYSHIRRLPPAHTITVSANEDEIKRYWGLDPNVKLKLPSRQAYIDRFTQLFDEAIRCRLRSNSPVGSFLSGGLDSSSITATASKELHESGGKLQTISAVFSETPLCDERRYISETVRTLDVDAHILECSGIDPFGSFREMTAQQASPIPTIGMYRVNHLLSDASKLGIRVMLDGHDGDSTVSHGIGYLDDLARAGKWRELIINGIGVAKVFGTQPHKLIWGYVRRFGTKSNAGQNKAAALARRISQAITRRITRKTGSLADLSKWILLPKSRLDTAQSLRVRYEEIALKTDEYSDEQHAHIAALTQPLQPYILESLDVIAGANAVEMRYPFFDKRLVEFCVAMPVELKIEKGWTRVILREAMRSRLPEKVLSRKTKTDFSEVIRKDAHLHSGQAIDQVIGTSCAIAYEYLDMECVQDAAKRFELDSSDQSLSVLYPAIALISWLESISTGNIAG